jgi:hypothetical protein
LRAYNDAQDRLVEVASSVSRRLRHALRLRADSAGRELDLVKRIQLEIYIFFPRARRA